MASWRCAPMASESGSRAAAGAAAGAGALIRAGVGVAGAAAAAAGCDGAAGATGVDAAGWAGVAGTAAEDDSATGAGLGSLGCRVVSGCGLAGEPWGRASPCSPCRQRSPSPRSCMSRRCRHPSGSCLRTHPGQRRSRGEARGRRTGVDELLVLRVPALLFRDFLFDSRDLHGERGQVSRCPDMSRRKLSSLPSRRAAEEGETVVPGRSARHRARTSAA